MPLLLHSAVGIASSLKDYMNTMYVSFTNSTIIVTRWNNQGNLMIITGEINK